ncbi:BTB/POZ domain-containing protein At5g67385-like isoform X1 [Chenopodium quinoa]|uniref:BTB/POZ domain-containing protein At5g67385-like isoform X1 n=1 Tax=Chenopodium quinoa TaxID=63459 RepID=UPI000B7919D6|nr:BTB/POZ domain-containing protein At5g67385-like isoform X1 [Chenopodium quinoa]XP_021751415.1 BTB/POZ domain-containing protein At5g67385-like isoform X1 [Chenopodium quinoa]XP_021751416.1 BTB/POZ domain-containing protein At5g67385-like isoform X1 [Chenopodium quinoa]
MMGLDQEEAPLTTGDMSSKKKELLSSAMKRTNECCRIISQEIPSDVTIRIGDDSFSLHKFPLLSKCGYLKKLVSESNDSDVCNVEIRDIPGGAEAFELAAKFCYGINFEISTENIAMLRCAAEYLEMTEDFAVENLVRRTETYLNEVALKSLSSCVSILLTSESLLPMAEQVKVVSRCVDAIAFLACKDSQFSGTNRMEGGIEESNSSLVPQQKPIVEFWWAEDLTTLRIDMFQRVLIAMTARGFKQYALGPLLMLYAQKSLRGLEVVGKGRKKLEPKQEHEKRVVLETIVSLLPREKNVLSVSFLATLLRSSIWLETTVACRLDLEKRMALQLGQAALDDLLIPSYCFTGDTLFDVDSVRRIMMNFLESEMEGNHLGYGAGEEQVFPPSNDLERVGRLMESYLAEIASDRNLTVSKFTGLAEIIPEQARVTEDGMYRAIDIFLKAHPTLSDLERKKVCSLMDCQKLSREACAHAAQNDRLPVQTVVQVLYYEQQRLRESMNESNDGNFNSSSGAIIPSKTLNLYSSTTPSADELIKLRRENEDLKIELLKLKMKLKEVEKPKSMIDNNTSVTSSPAKSTTSASDQKPPLPRKSFMTSVKKLGRLLIPADGGVLSTPRRAKASKGRRHSIS